MKRILLALALTAAAAGSAPAQVSTEHACRLTADYVRRLGMARNNGYPYRYLVQVAQIEGMYGAVQDHLAMLFQNPDLTPDEAAAAFTRYCLAVNGR